MADRIEALHVGTLTAGSVTLPASSVTSTSVQAAAGIEYSKLENLRTATLKIGNTTTIAAADETAFTVKGATGALVFVTASITGTIATGADRTVTIDVQKSTGEAAFATVLSATIGFTNASILRRTYDGTFSSTALVTDDHIKITVAVAGAAGNQALGLIVTLHWWEDPA